MHWCHAAIMSALTIRDVPDDQIQTLKVRAAQAGKSLQAYCLDLIARETSKPTLAEGLFDLRLWRTFGGGARGLTDADVDLVMIVCG
jgi:hypothetical protein